MEKRKIIALTLSLAFILSSSPSLAEETSFISEESDVIEISSIYPADNAENVSVIEDITVELAEGSVMSEENVEVAGNGIPDYNVKIEGETVNIEFTKELPYETEITVKIGNNIRTFTTERNPITTLYWQDFEDVTLDFTNLSVAENSTLKVGGATAKITAPECSCSDTANHDALCSVGYPWNLQVLDGYLAMKNQGKYSGNNMSVWNNNLKMIIDGSENWTDYRISADIWGQHDFGQIYLGLRDTEETDKHGVVVKGAMNGSGSNDGDLLLYTSTSTAWNFINIHRNEDILPNTWTKLSAEIVGNTVTYWQGPDDSAAKYSWAFDNVAEKGAVWYAPGWSQSRIDNILVEDKALLFTPETLKNVKNELTLNFNNTLDESAIEHIKVLKDGVDQNAKVTLSTDARKVYVNVSALATGEKYTLCVGNDVMSADGTKMSSEKNVLFTVSDDFGVLRFAPSEDEQEVSVLSDIKIELSQALSDSDIGEYISVDGMTKDKYDIKLTDGRIIDVIFKDALPYDSDIRVTVKKGLTAENGKALEKDVKWTFHTEIDTSDILYYQDFEDVTLDFTTLSVAENSTLKVGGATAKITAPECSCSDTANHDGTCSVGYPWNLQVLDGYLAMKNQGKYSGTNVSTGGNNLKMIIDGSENWTDYKISADIWGQHDFGWVLLGLRDTNEADKHGLVVVGAMNGTGNNDGDLLLYKSTGTAWDFIQRQGNEDILPNTWTKLSAEMVGNAITYWKGPDEGAAKYSWNSDGVAEKGGVWYAPGWSQTRIDNIMVIDKGLKFTPSTTKFTDGKMTLDFDEPMNTENSPAVVFVDEEGNEVNVAARWQSDRSIAIDAKGLKNGEVYTVTLKRDGIESLEGKPLASDKSCRVIADVPYYIENIKISDMVVGETVSASADITDYGKAEGASYMLVLAVFDERGALYSIATDTKKNLEEGEKTAFSVTSIALPENIEGYKAECYIWDNMQDITHISGPVCKP